MSACECQSRFGITYCATRFPPDQTSLTWTGSSLIASSNNSTLEVGELADGEIVTLYCGLSINVE